MKISFENVHGYSSRLHTVEQTAPTAATATSHDTI